MVLSTSQLRREYAPACRTRSNIYISAYQALDAAMKRHGYRPRSGVTGAYNCRTITGGSGYSLHAYGPGTSFTFWTGVRIPTSLAVDINWDRNPYGPRLVTDMPRAMINEIYNIRTNSGAQVWGWGGYYSGSKDAMHFEIVCSKAALATGIRGGTAPTPTPPEEDIMASVQELRLILKEQEDRQNAWTRSEIDKAVAEIKGNNVILRDGLAALIRRVAAKLGVTGV